METSTILPDLTPGRERARHREAHGAGFGKRLAVGGERRGSNRQLLLGLQKRVRLTPDVPEL